MPKIYNAPPGFEMNPIGYAAELRALRAEAARLRIEIADAKHAMRAYAAENPRHQYDGQMQDPNGVHSWLARNDRHNDQLNATGVSRVVVEAPVGREE